MSLFFVGTEAKIFCLIIIAFIYFFQTKNFKNPAKELSFTYVFMFMGILFSILGNGALNIFFKNLFFAICAVCYAISVFFLCGYIFINSRNRKNIFIKCIIFLGSVLFGLLAFYSSVYCVNMFTFMLVFAVMVNYIAEQHKQIMVDNLTKLYNRYGMDSELREQLMQYERENEDSFYIIACDLDKFKYINDTWGHLEGDRALVLTAKVLSKVSKKFDSNVFRIGGDEFVIITDKSEKGLADDITNSIKDELDKLEFRDDYNIKMSIGVALYDGVTPIDELLNNADKKLYDAKKNSRK